MINTKMFEIFQIKYKSFLILGNFSAALTIISIKTTMKLSSDLFNKFCF